MKKLVSLVVVAALSLAMVGCGGAPASTGSASAGSASVQASAAKPTTDPSGAKVSIPDSIDSIVCLSPAVNEVLADLGLGDKLVGIDTQSVSLAGMPDDVPTFDLVNPDMEQLAALAPDVLFVSNMTMYDQDNPYQQLIDMGTCVLNVPNAESISEIEEDVTFIADAMGESEAGAKLVKEMRSEIDRIAEIGKTITDRKSVYFEISAAPSMYSFGNGVYLNEMIELIGAKNILADQDGWLPVESEVVVDADPDVILTNVNYIEDAPAEIMSRDGWSGMTAVQEGQVFYIDNMSSSLPNHNIVKALEQMAKAVYPDAYGA